MALGMKELVAEARANVQAVTPQQAQDSGELILDVREPAELESSGRVAGAVNIPRGVQPMRDSVCAARAARAPDPQRTWTRPAPRRRVSRSSAVGVPGSARDDATVIEGGMTGWKGAGLPVEGR